MSPVRRAAGEAGGRVRPATPRDLDRVAELWAAIGDHHAPLDASFRQRPDAASRMRDHLAAQLSDADAAVLVRDDGGDLHGLCIAHLEHAPPLLVESSRVQITDLFVREGRRRCGIATALVEAALAWAAARGADRVQVSVAAGNREGQAFWRARGFADLMDVLHKRL